MRASIVISTKNRADELRVALQSCVVQTCQPEIIVIDDASDDGTSDMVKSEFPQVRLVTKTTSEGYIVQRNLGARLATGEIIFSIDDDAEFSTPRVVEQTLQDFDDSRVSAVAIPLVEPNYGPEVMQRAPDLDRLWVTASFKGTAYAIRRDTFLMLGGFCVNFVHQGEEGDLCIRLLNSGYFVRLGRSDPIIHHESPKRDLRRMHFYGRRNDLLFAVRNAPVGWLGVHMIATTFNGLRASIGVSHPTAMYAGILRGWVDGARQVSGRTPVSLATYRTFRRLRLDGPEPI